MVVAHQRVHLRFSCQPAKRAGKYDAVVIRQKRIAPFDQRIKLIIPFDDGSVTDVGQADEAQGMMDWLGVTAPKGH